MSLHKLISLVVLLVVLDCCQGQTWNIWEDWATCSSSCGKGKTTRWRTCQGPSHCTGPTQETGYCVNPVDCMWGEWGPFSGCSVTCGPGVVTSYRVCNNGNNTENMCEGSANMTQPCQLPACPTWNEWGEWAPCPVTCGNSATAIRFRGRTCNGTSPCAGNSTESSPCSPLPPSCPGEWSEWTNLPCSKTCGPGTQVRTRTCPIPGTCPGQSYITVGCNEGPCVSHDNWGTWTEWGACNATCGRGKRTRTRTCLGSHCRGRPRQSRRCPGLKPCRGGGGRPCRRRRGCNRPGKGKRL